MPTVTGNPSRLECGATGQHLKQIKVYFYSGTPHGNYKSQKITEIRDTGVCLDFKLKGLKQRIGHNVMFKYSDIHSDLLCRKPLMG